MNIKEQDLVMLRLPNNLEMEGRKRYYNTWFRVLFIDNDETFIGKCEKIDMMEFELYKKNEVVKLNKNQIQHIYVEGEQFCYGDNLTICSCPALCRNK